MSARTRLLFAALAPAISVLTQLSTARAQGTPAATTPAPTTDATPPADAPSVTKPANPNDDSDEVSSNAAPAASTVDPSVAAAAAASKTAAATATPLSASRGGTLGFPAMGAPGIVAALSLQGSTGQTTKLDVIAQIGQIQLKPWLTLDVVAEKVSTDVPTATFTPNTGTPLPKLIQTDLTSVGFRFRLGNPGATPADKRRLSACLTAKRFLPEAARIERSEAATDGAKVAKAQRSAKTEDIEAAQDAQAAHAKKNHENVTKAATLASCPDIVPDNGAVLTDADLFEAYQRLAEQANAGLSLAVGARLLYRSQDIAGAAPGAAAEFTPQYGFPGGSAIFASESVLWLSSSETETDGIHATTSELSELKTTVGAYYKFNAPVRGVQTAPRIGGYGSLSRNFWTNPYPADGTEAKIRGYQFEGGVFVSGHFSGGFNGLLQMGMRRSYGVDSKPEFFFTVVPSLGTDTGGAT